MLYFSMALYSIVLTVALYLSERMSLWSRILLFFILFFYLSALVEFDGFKFYLLDVTYEYRADVFFSLSTVTAVLLLVLYYYGRGGEKISGSRFPESASFVVAGIWCIALIALIVDLFYNFDFIVRDKSEYIGGLDEQVKNLYFFTLSAKVILLDIALFYRFKGYFGKLVIVVGFAALLLDFFMGYRLLTLFVVLYFLLPRVRVLGYVMLLLFFTFFGELSNLAKIVFKLAITDQYLLYNYLENFFSQSFELAASTEQKAFLTNLIIKLDDFSLFQYYDFPFQILNGIPVLNQLLSSVGVEVVSPGLQQGEYVGVGFGQGTGYSYVLTVLENFGTPIFIYLLMFYLFKKIGFNLFFLSFSEVFYSSLRTDITFWLYQWIKLLIIYHVILYVSMHWIRRRNIL